MKINYKKLNDILDFIYTVGFAVLFMILGLFIKNFIYNVVAYSYGAWIITLWLKSIFSKKNSGKKISENVEVKSPTISTQSNIIHPVPH
ncbi:MAG: hypothetical protein ACTSRZ_01320 [Promethearchaeota archaeon]